MSDKAKPEVTPKCCSVWPEISGSFRWFKFKEWPTLKSMPCIPFSDYRVNYCPSCGKDRRGTIEERVL